MSPTGDSSDQFPIISESPTLGSESLGGDASWDDDSLHLNETAGSKPPPEAPKQIGDYEIRQLIGSGGMGNVYLARHVRMQRIVAIKMLPIERMHSEDAVERFYAEVRAASRLLHPNIVTAFDAGEVEAEKFGKVHYLAMEYVDGLTLTQAVASTGPMSVGEAAAAIRQAAIGLLHAHRAGIVHRDVKPGNLMRASDGTIKVLDLGLAQINTSAMIQGSQDADDTSTEETQKSSRGRLVGTLPFMSPEQLEDPDAVDSRSDIYSLGATLYFLLTATPPFTGEYLDQVYGHRHGEIPDLMQVRGDVDLNFSDIFSRMMAKKPDERYDSLDEVIDALSDYTSETDSPAWLSEFSQRQTVGDVSTVSGGSTSGETARVFGIDLGMFYSASAEATPIGETRPLSCGSDRRYLFRMAIASRGDQLLFDQDAIDLRADYPLSTAHCLLIYLGQPKVARKMAGRECSPEALIAMILRQIFARCWDNVAVPHATAITVPGSYDQMRRRSVMQAAQLAGFTSVRLVDRSVAAIQALCIPAPDAPQPRVQIADNQIFLFVGLTGQATEISVVRGRQSRQQQLATKGHWSRGTLVWLNRLVGWAKTEFQKQHGLDFDESIKAAANLQIACESAMNAMLLAEEADIEITMGGQRYSIAAHRDQWLEECEDLIKSTRLSIRMACEAANIKLSEIDHCVLLGVITRLPRVKKRLLKGVRSDAQLHSIDRMDIARGAASCLASELPGRGDVPLPPRGVTGQTIGLVVEDAKKRRRILPLIPRGTSLPARTNKRLTATKERPLLRVSLVESAGADGNEWQALGRHDIELPSGASDTVQTVSFEVNVNGLMSVRAATPLSTAQAGDTPGRAKSHTSIKLPELPTPLLAEDDLRRWKKWIETVS